MAQRGENWDIGRENRQSKQVSKKREAQEKQQ